MESRLSLDMKQKEWLALVELALNCPPPCIELAKAQDILKKNVNALQAARIVYVYKD